MPEEFVVLRCKECRMFQKHISRKSTKFCCKICGEKQSILRCYSNGTGAECRRTVQRLNSTCAEADSDEVDEELERYSDELHEDVLRRNGYNSSRRESDAFGLNETDFNETDLNEPDLNETDLNESDLNEPNGDIDYENEAENNNEIPDEGFDEEYRSNSNRGTKSNNSRSTPIDFSSNESDSVNCNGHSNHSKHNEGSSRFSSADISCRERIDIKSSDSSPRAKRSKYSIF